MTKHGPHPSAAVHAHHRTRNPWSGLPQPGDSHSTHSSASSRTYHAVNPPSESYYQEPLDATTGRYPDYALPYTTHRAASPHYDRPRLSSRPATPASANTDAGVDACGGHCVAFENFCHYCLQVLFIAGILTGVSLTVAGSVLRGQKRGGDLVVLVYIGCLTAMVCTLLLSVQCCVRGKVERRKRARRARMVRGETIALQELGQPALGGRQFEPLLRRLVEQQICDENQRYTAEPSTAISFPGEDHSGIPWWRREAATKDLHR